MHLIAVQILKSSDKSKKTCATVSNSTQIIKVFNLVSRFIKKERTIAKDTTVIDKEYKLPDGQVIIVGRERFEAPEILMNPALIDDESEDCATMIYNSICGCPLDIQKELAANIYLSGGTSMIPGISARLEYEI